MLQNLILFGGLLVIFYVVVILPQQRKYRNHSQMISNLKEGDQVITMGGIYATITGLEADKAELQIADDVRIWMVKEAIGRKIEIPT